MAVTRQQVAELYVATFNRAPDAAGLDYWVNDSGLTIEQIAMSFFDQPETQALYPTGTTDEAFVTSIYTNLFGRAPDAAGLAYWTGADGLGGTMTRSVMIEAMKNGATGDDATLVANKATVGLYYADKGLEGTDFSLASVTDDAATVTAATGSIDTDAAADAAKTYTLTAGADVLEMSPNNDTVTAAAGTLGSTDIIQDESTTDNDTLNASISDTTATGIKPTLKNIENVNLTWTSNAGLEFNAVNSTGNTLNLTATALAFSGDATIDEVGTNDVNADSTINGTLDLQEVVASTVDAGSATVVTLTTGTATTVGQKTSADVTINNSITGLTNTVENLTFRAATDGLKVTDNGATAIADQLTIAGDKSMTYKGIVTGEKIVNDLTAGTLTVQANDVGAINVAKIDADVIEFTAAATAIAVADNQNFLVKSAANASLTSFIDGTGVTNATVNLKSQMGGTAITSLDVTSIANLNLESDLATEIGTLVLDDNNNVTITGDSTTTIGAMTGTTGATSIDASALTGAFVVTSTSVDVATGIVGSSTAKNTISTAATSANVTLVTGSGDDSLTAASTTGKVTINAGDGKNTIDVSSVSTGTASVTSGSGNDTVDLSSLVGGKATVSSGAGDDKVTLGASATSVTEFTFDGGLGTDTLVIGNVDLSAAKVFSLSGVENMVITTGATLAGSQLSGGTYSIAAAVGGGTLNIDVVNPNAELAITTDLDALQFSTSTSSNFSSVVITGLDDVADTIYGTTMADTIDAGDGAKDLITISAGGNDIIQVNLGDSTYATGADKMDAITGFNAATKAGGADLLQFATAGAIGNGTADTDVKGAISGGTGLETVTGTIDASGILTIAGADAGSIDTLAEWMKVAETVLEDGSLVAGATVGFEFSGSTYIYTVNADDGSNNVTGADIVQLVGLTGVSALAVDGNADFAEGAANTVLIG